MTTSRPITSGDITPELIAQKLELARNLRAAAFRSLLAALFRKPARLQPKPQPVPTRPSYV